MTPQNPTILGDSKEVVSPKEKLQAQVVESNIEDSDKDFEHSNVDRYTERQAQPSMDESFAVGDLESVFPIELSKKGDTKQDGTGVEIEESTTSDAVLESLERTEEDTDGLTATEMKQNILGAAEPPGQAEPEDDWTSFSTKKSKKEKKKRKSGLHTPTMESPIGQSILVKVASHVPTSTEKLLVETALRSHDDTEGIEVRQPTHIESNPDFIATELAVTHHEEWGVPVTKKSKKDRKKRKSGLSTPVQETSAGLSMLQEITVEKPSIERVEETTSKRTIVPEILQAEQVAVQSMLGELDPVAFTQEIIEEQDDGWGMPATKKSKKKDKKRKSGLLTPTEPSTRVAASPPWASDLHLEPSITDDRKISAPVPFVEPEEKTVESPTAMTTSNAILAETQREDISSSLSRTSSKKDKRKRHPTTLFDPNLETQAVAWADDVLEADIERNHPVIEDIDKDPSLSHIASTVESPPQDDFLRPTKKGKSGVRRLSAPPSPALEGMIAEARAEAEQKTLPATQSVLPVISTTGAELAPEPSELAPSEVREYSKHFEAQAKSEAIQSTTPTEKLSKKEKRKKSIDKRSPSNDMFDDPMLWEEAEPKAFQESRGVNDDGGDGFWSPPNEAISASASKLVHDGPPGNISHSLPEAHNFTSRSAVELHTSGGLPANLQPLEPNALDTAGSQEVGNHSRDPPGAEGLDTVSSELQRPKEQWNDLPDEFIITSKKGKKNKKKAARLSAWEPPAEKQTQGSEVAVGQPSELGLSQGHNGERETNPASETAPIPLAASNALGIVEAPVMIETSDLESTVLGQNVPHVVLSTESLGS